MLRASADDAVSLVFQSFVYNAVLLPSSFLAFSKIDDGIRGFFLKIYTYIRTVEKINSILKRKTITGDYNCDCEYNYINKLILIF